MNTGFGVGEGHTRLSPPVKNDIPEGRVATIIKTIINYNLPRWKLLYRERVRRPERESFAASTRTTPTEMQQLAMICLFGHLKFPINLKVKTHKRSVRRILTVKHKIRIIYIKLRHKTIEVELKNGNFNRSIYSIVALE